MWSSSFKQKMDSVAVVTNLVETVYDEDCKKSFKKEKLKFLLVYIFSTVVLVLVCINTVLLEDKGSAVNTPMSSYIQWKCENFTYNQPPLRFDYIDKYPLTEEVYVRICQVDGNITIDIRQVEDERETKKGIRLNKMQWQYLKTSIDHIDSSILKMSHVDNS